jgi:hypothetical protein
VNCLLGAIDDFGDNIHRIVFGADYRFSQSGVEADGIFFLGKLDLGDQALQFFRR